MPYTPANPICVALDAPDRERAERLADAVEESAGTFKVGATLFVAEGGEVVSSLAARRPVFLDLKLHDIPAQIEGAVGAASTLGARLLSVHASGGSDMLRAAVDAAMGRLEILAVTVLTSLDDAALDRLGASGSVLDQVMRLAEIAVGAGAPGLVCSAREVRAIRERFGKRSEGGPLVVVPGIRGHSGAAADQRRVTTPGEALDAGADVLVIGRPIIAAADPDAAARTIAAQLGL